MPKKSDGGGVRPTDPSTAHEAAARIKVQPLERLVYDVLIEHGARKPIDHWMSTLEIETYLERHPDRTGWLKGGGKWSISLRMKPLREKGMVETIKQPRLNTSGKIRNFNCHRAIPERAAA